VTFDATEKSIRSASPIELYEFLSSYNRYLYTSYHTDVTITPDVYIAEAISRSKIVIEGEVNKANITITIPYTTEIAQLFSVQPPPNPVTIAVYRYHSTDSITNKILYWSGRILSTRWKMEVVEFSCESIYTSIQRYGLTRTYQLPCPYVLYTSPCGASAGDFVVITNTTTVSGANLVVSSLIQPDNYFSGGYIEFTKAGSLTEFRSILSHTGTSIGLSYNIPGLVDGDEIKLFPGCKRTIDDCNNKFNVGEDFGGFPYIPNINPFNGGMLF